MKSCYRHVSPALPTTAWIGETRWLLAFSPWEPQASCLPPSQASSPKGLPGLVQAWAWACQPISGQPPGGGAEKGAGPLDSPALLSVTLSGHVHTALPIKAFLLLPFPCVVLLFLEGSYGRWEGGAEPRGLGVGVGWSLKGLYKRCSELLSPFILLPLLCWDHPILFSV